MLVNDKPHVVLFAITTIPAGTEIRYDYGGYVPWRKVTKN